MANPVTEFFFTMADVINDLGKEAVTDIRTTWEESWFGRELTPDAPGGGDPLGRFEAAVEKVGGDLEAVGREGVTVIEAAGARIDKAFDKLFDELAKERENRAQPEHEHEQGLDR